MALTEPERLPVWKYFFWTAWAVAAFFDLLTAFIMMSRGEPPGATMWVASITLAVTGALVWRLSLDDEDN